MCAIIMYLRLFREQVAKYSVGDGYDEAALHTWAYCSKVT